MEQGAVRDTGSRMGMTGSVSNERLRGANRCLFVVLKHLSYLVYDSHGADKRAAMQKGREKGTTSAQ